MNTTKNKTDGFDLDQSAYSKQDLAKWGGQKLVYVRQVIAKDVMEDLIDEDGGVVIAIDDDDILYSVHAANGERIALVGDRDTAFAAARQYEMNPVSVH